MADNGRSINRAMVLPLISCRQGGKICGSFVAVLIGKQSRNQFKKSC